MCDDCGGTGMWDVLSSIPCKCMKKKIDTALLLKQIIEFKKKALKEKRFEDAVDFKDIENKLRDQLKGEK